MTEADICLTIASGYKRRTVYDGLDIYVRDTQLSDGAVIKIAPNDGCPYCGTTVVKYGIYMLDATYMWRQYSCETYAAVAGPYYCGISSQTYECMMICMFGDHPSDDII